MLILLFLIKLLQTKYQLPVKKIAMCQDLLFLDIPEGEKGLTKITKDTIWKAILILKS